MQSWTPHTDPLFTGYNVPPLSEQEQDAFFARYTAPGTISLAGEAGGRVAAHILLRGYDAQAGTADLGISMDAGLIGKGYGTRILLALKSFVGERYAIKRLTLDVASFNRRALAAYLKAGFREERRTWMLYDTTMDLGSLAADPANAWLREHVRIDTGYMISLVHMSAEI